MHKLKRQFRPWLLIPIVGLSFEAVAPRGLEDYRFQLAYKTLSSKGMYECELQKQSEDFYTYTTHLKGENGHFARLALNASGSLKAIDTTATLISVHVSPDSNSQMALVMLCIAALIPIQANMVKSAGFLALLFWMGLGVIWYIICRSYNESLLLIEQYLTT